MKTQTWCNQGTGMPANRHPTTSSLGFGRLGTLIYSSDAPSFVNLTGLFLFLLNTLMHAHIPKFCLLLQNWQKVTGPLHFRSKPKRNANNALLFFHPTGVFFLLNHLVVNTWRTRWACTRSPKVQGEAFFRVPGPWRCASISARR